MGIFTVYLLLQRVCCTVACLKFELARVTLVEWEITDVQYFNDTLALFILIDWLIFPVGPGFYPPVMRQLSLPEDTERWGVDPSYSMTRSAEAMAKAKGNGRGKKYNLMAQVIPIYGFGILLYILYIIYKVMTLTTWQLV